MDNNPKTFNQDKVTSNEKNKAGGFQLIYSYYANGNFEMCCSDSTDSLTG